jgi:hypothetical protein
VIDALAEMVRTYPGWTLVGLIGIGWTLADSIGRVFGRCRCTNKRGGGR